MKRITMPAVCTAASLSLLFAACSSAPPAPEPPPPAPPEPAAFVEKLDSDGLFAFGKSDLENVSAEGRAALDALVARLTSGRAIDVVHVIGHSDRIGNAAGNLRLSSQRAETVRGYLLEHGVPDERITAVGRGDVEPVAACDSERGEALIQCLAPNRRVEVRVRFAD